jgi:nitrogen fixation protein FixH
MNWGKGLALAMVAFAGMMAYFLVRAARSPEPLIAENYYEQELGFQDRIDATSRTLALSGTVRFDAARDRISVAFPEEVMAREILGTLRLLHANDTHDDHSVVIPAAPEGRFEEVIDLRPGRYIAQLEWSADGITYYSEAQLLVP